MTNQSNQDTATDQLNNNNENNVNELAQTVQQDHQKNLDLIRQQDKVKEILEVEQDNLQRKYASYEEISKTQEREAFLKKNSSSRLKQYNYLAMVIVFTIALLLVLSQVDKFEIISEGYTTLLRVIIVALSLLWSYSILRQLQTRDPLNYDKLYLEKPRVDSDEEVERKRKLAEQNGDLLGSVNNLICSGDSCCDPNTTVWDSEKMLCVPKTADGFTNIRPNEPIPNFSKL
tara:strand:- start:1033 stop:1725 length:693 start_codon:yes stop_codon:yes gene_type:complete